MIWFHFLIFMKNLQENSDVAICWVAEENQHIKSDVGHAQPDNVNVKQCLTYKKKNGGLLPAVLFLSMLTFVTKTYMSEITPFKKFLYN